MRAATRCFSCGARGLIAFHEQRCVPLGTALLATRQEAFDFPTGHIRLAFCPACGFVQNVLFDPRRLDEAPQNPHSGTTTDDESIRLLAEQLVERYDLHGKDVLDIGGDASFLAELCRLGANRGVGIQAGDSAAPVAERAEFVSGRFSLDRTQRVGDLIQLLRRSINQQRAPVLFFEVGDVERILRGLAFWEARYDRCSYFSLGSLARLFRSRQFQVLDLHRNAEAGSLRIDAVAGVAQDGPFWDGEQDVDHLKSLIAYFRDNSATRLHAWNKTLHRVRSAGQRAVLWGSGAPTASLLSAAGRESHDLFVVDGDSGRQGRFLAGHGNEVVAPAFLREYRPDVVISVAPESPDQLWLDLRFGGLDPELIIL